MFHSERKVVSFRCVQCQRRVVLTERELTENGRWLLFSCCSSCWPANKTDAQKKASEAEKYTRIQESVKRSLL